MGDELCYLNPYPPMHAVPFVWDKYLPAGTFKQDMNGLWHVGEGTDLKVVLFDASLTGSDKRFLKALKIQTVED